MSRIFDHKVSYGLCIYRIEMCSNMIVEIPRLWIEGLIAWDRYDAYPVKEMNPVPSDRVEFLQSELQVYISTSFMRWRISAPTRPEYRKWISFLT
jgi:hypothetical protein